MSVSLAQASTIIDVALKVARDQKQMPQTIIVLDAGGHVVCAKREDGLRAYGRRVRVIEKKPQGAVNLQQFWRNTIRRGWWCARDGRGSRRTANGRRHGGERQRAGLRF